jgi:prepilin-type N-terminal cleavage/methylation domain-containing protein
MMDFLGGGKVSKGFTIVELGVVIVVIGILATITTLGYTSWQQSINSTQVKSDLSGVAAAMENARTFGDIYPSAIPANFTASDGVDLAIFSSDASTFCVDGYYTTDPTNTYYIDQDTIRLGAQEGTCFTRPGCWLPGFISVPGSSTYGTSDFCIMKYEAKDVSGEAVSEASGYSWTNLTHQEAAAAAAAVCDTCHLVTIAEWLTIAKNILQVPTNWSGGAVGSGYVYYGHNTWWDYSWNPEPNGWGAKPASSDDNDGYYLMNATSGKRKRTLKLNNDEIIWDFSGNAWEMADILLQGPAGTQPGVIGSGGGWREWPNVSYIGTVIPGVFPASTGIAGASSWTQAANGIGKINSDADYDSGSHTGMYLKSVHLGCGWYDPYLTVDYCGLMAVDMSKDGGNRDADVGFRVAYTY